MTDMKEAIRKATDFMSDVCAIWVDSLRSIVKDEGLFIFFVLLPVAYPILYSWIYNNEVVREVPVAVVDNSHSELSRRFVSEMDASPDVNVAYFCGDMEEAKNLMGHQQVYGIVYIPEDFSTRVNRMEQSSVSVYCNMAIMLAYKAVFQTATAVSADMNATIQKKLLGNHTDREDEIATSPLRFEEVPIFNSTGGYGNFILPGVLVLIIQQVLLLGIGMANGTMREHGRYGDLQVYMARRFGLLRIMSGKLLCYFVLFAFMSAFVLLAVPRMFSFVQILHFGDFMLFIVPYLLACIFFATTVSFFVRQRENVMLLVVFTSLPLLFMSGLSWPQSDIPWLWDIFSCLFPSTFGIRAFVKMNTMGAEFADIRTEFVALWIQAVLYSVTACIAMKLMISNRKSRF